VLCSSPREITKSNSSRARREDRQVVWPDRKLDRARGEQSTWESVIGGSPLARGSAATLDLPQRGVSGWLTTEPQDKNHRVDMSSYFCWFAIPIHKLVFTHSYIVVVLLLLHN
jgi:hypothetical protein